MNAVYSPRIAFPQPARKRVRTASKGFSKGRGWMIVDFSVWFDPRGLALERMEVFFFLFFFLFFRGGAGFGDNGR